jgi:hypothetical protein
MERRASPVLPARGALEGVAAPQRRGGPLRDALLGLRNSCALAGVALLGCLALIALGTVCSLLWMLVAER